MKTFATILDSAETLSLDEQAEIAEILRHRVAEKRRAEIIAAVKESRAEFASGKLKPATAKAIFNRLVKRSGNYCPAQPSCEWREGYRKNVLATLKTCWLPWN